MKFFQHLKGDLFGGLTAGVVALPLALAFGVQSGLGAIAGLYGAIFIGFFASLFGGTNTQISGPTAPMTAVSMVIIAGIIQLNEGSLENALPAILAIFLMAGLMQIGLGALKLGKYIKYIPYPVVSGFMTGIGVIILLTQVLPAIGYYPDQDQTYVDSFNPLAQEVLLNEILSDEAGENLLVLDNFEATVLRAQQITPQQITTESRTLAKKNSSGVVGAIKTMPRAFQNIDITELSIALITILIIFGFKRITTTIPSTLIALLGVTLGVFFLDVDARKLGEIPSGFPLPNLEIFTEFNFGQVSPYLFSALTLALLGAIDSLLTSVVADNMTKTRHDPNKELLGQGIGNSIASIFGGIPGAGATIRTVVNINSGGKTRLSGMVGAVLLLIIVLALGSYASEIPSAVLAGILITVGIGVMDYKGLKVIRHIPKSDVIIMFTVLILTVTWDLVYAVGIGLVIASLIFMKKMGDANAAKSKIKTLSRKEDYGNEDYSLIPLDLREEVFIKELDGPLFFGSTKDFQSMSQNVPDRATHVIIRMERVPFMDQSGLFAFEEVARSLIVKEIIPLLVGLKEQPKYRLEAIDIIPDLIKKEHLFETYTDCVDWVNLNVENVIDHDGNAVVKP